MKNFTVVLIFSMALTMLLFTNCGAQPSAFSTTANNSLDDGSTNGSANGNSSNGGSSNGTSTGGASSAGGTIGVDRLSQGMANQLKNEFIPQVGKVPKADNRYSTALFGIAREMVQYPAPKYSFKKIYVSTSYLKNKGYPALVRKSSNAKAPLAIVLYPLYSNEITGQMNRYLDFFAAKNYHVIAFMNTWSPEVIAASPNFFPGDLWKEAPMHLALINQVVSSEFGGRANINGATLMGVSYGAFMSAIVKAYDQQSGNPIITGPTLILSPPFDMVASLKTIDTQVKAISATDAISCALSGGFFNFINAASSISDYNQTNIDEKCTKWLFTAVGFYTTLQTSIVSLNASKALNLPVATMTSITYEKYMNNVAKIAPPTNQSDMGYWLAVSRNLGYDKVTVVASVDDNINEGKSLGSNAYYNFNSPALLLLPTGGHVGFVEAKSTNKACGKDWTDCFIKAIYN